MNIPASITKTEQTGEEVKTLFKAIGVQLLAGRLGVGTNTLYEAISNNKISAAHYQIVEEEADKIGLECPLSLFNFKRAEAAK